MMSLFFSFDLGNFHKSFLFLFISISLIFNKIWNGNLLNTFLSSLFSNLMSFFLSLKPQKFNKFSLFLFISSFVFLLSCNYFSVFSFNFPMSSQVSVISMFSLGFWFSLISFSLLKNMKGFLSHLIPEDTPLPLTFLLLAIELVSNIIRPLTLMVRLVANIMAGHLLMNLLSILVFFFPLALPFYVGLNMVELFVSLIQSYIFSTMMVLYFSEI